METREAGPADAEQLLDWMIDFNRIEGIAYDRERLALALAPLLSGATPPGRALVASVDGRGVGYAVVGFSYDLEFGGRDGWLTEVYLVPEARGRGLSRALVDAAAQMARAHGVGALHLSVRPQNAPALALYRGAGFQPWTRLAFTRKLG